MISTNIFRAIADFCTNILFIPYDVFRFTDGWWTSNIVNAIFISIGLVLLFYWLGRLQSFRKTENE
ncbi:MAG: uracil phosphoribosyltransferase [Flavobacteriaceae bacterium]|nr:uracil phosphoribosyltransferase [Flavobacteriaceae bacterium]